MNGQSTPPDAGLGTPRASHGTRVALRVLVLGGLIVAVGLLLMENRNELWPEIAQAGLQIIVVGVIAALVGNAVEEAERRQEKLRREIAERLDLLRRLRAVYSDVKRARGYLQALRWRTALEAPMDSAGMAAYREQMAKVRDAELALEELGDELRAGLGKGSPTARIRQPLETMENYLSQDLRVEYRDYERTGRGTADAASVNPFSTLAHLQRFTADPEEITEFARNIEKPYRDALRVLIDDISARTEKISK